MKYCSCCNKEYSDKYSECPNCGNPMAHIEHHVCPHCHRELPSNDVENCPYCLSELEGVGPKRAKLKKQQSLLETSQQRHEEYMRNQLVETPKRPNWTRRFTHLVVLALAFLLLAVCLLPVLSFTNGEESYNMSMFTAGVNEVKYLINVAKKTSEFKLESYYLLDLILAALLVWNVIKFLILFFNLLSQARHKDEQDCKKDAKRNIFHAVLGIIHGVIVYVFALIGPSKILNAEVKSNMDGVLYYSLIIVAVSVLLLILAIASVHTKTVKVKQGEVKAYHKKKHFGQGLLAFLFALIIIAGAGGAGYLFYTEMKDKSASPTLIVETKTE